MPIVFISYSHDSDEHKQRVLSLSERLRDDGIETRLDQYVNGTPEEGWYRWILNRLDEAQFVLVICTETYYRRFRGLEEPDKGKGADFEGALITHEIYKARSKTVKFVPILFAAEDQPFIPEPLDGPSFYQLTNQSGYDSLYDFLLGLAGVEPRPVGTVKPRSRKTASPLTFDDSPSFKADISRIIKYAPAELIGREAETALLNDAWAKVQNHEPKRPHVLTFVALGGEGKTSLVAKWAADLAAQDWPGCEAVFAWSFYSQGSSEQNAASSDLFLAEALRFFGDEAMAGSAQGAFEKGKRLAQIVGQQRALLILDGLEPLQYAPTSPLAGELKDHGLAALLKGLATINNGLCVVTTRYRIPDLRAYWQNTAPMHDLPRLSKAAGVKLLQTIGVKGTQAEFEMLVEDVDGHALTLQIFGQFLVRAFGGDIRKRDRVKLEKADAKIQGGHAFRAMAAYEKWMEDDSDEARRELAILKLLGLFDRPATADCLAALLQLPAIPGLTDPLVGLPEEDLQFSLTALRDAKLITFAGEAGGFPHTSFNLPASIDAHPLLREYFSQRMKGESGMMNEGEDSSFILQNSAFQLAHRRLYEHLCATTKEGDQPTLEDLQPLYQAVAHGCQAGLQQEACDDVYLARIYRRNVAYSASKLGAFGSDLGAVACFFEQPWSSVSTSLTETAQAWLLSQAAAWLRALGRLTEALEPMQAGLKMGVKQKDWKEAAIRANNLSELELILGEVAGAVEDAELSVNYADRSGDAFHRMARRASQADALHKAGRRAEAESPFREADQMQAERQPDYPIFPSPPNFNFCEFLLANVERAAWRATLNLNVGLQTSEIVEKCQIVEERARKTLSWNGIAFQATILSPSLDHLTLGRAALYQAILAEQSDIQTPKSEIENSVNGHRRANRSDYLPRALLTRAWLRALTGAHSGQDSAQEDLDEAWDIAERGSMKLHMADIHLYRARLFGLRNADGGWRSGVPYPWDSPEHDLAEAERLINECGYHRRDEELADAKRAILGQ